MTKKLANSPRQIYTPFMTPIEELSNLKKRLGQNSPTLFIKRDDQLGLALGGNKTRKLEYLMADALAQGCDSIITTGAVQSNHCRLTLSAARKEGLACHLLVEERVPNSYNEEASGNNFLFHLMQADSITVKQKGCVITDELQSIADSLRKNGAKPYIIPGGGSNVVGTMGYVNGAFEIMTQLTQPHISITDIICTSGSSGTQAGLLAGLAIKNADIPVIGISINRKKDEQSALIHRLTNDTLEFLEAHQRCDIEDIVVKDAYIGDGYSLPTEAMVNAVSLLAKTEGIILDPSYTGKAFAGMLDLIKEGYFSKDDRLLFIHTGGSPALFAYTKLWM